MNDRLQWFNDRIGKRIFRNKTTCKCEVCANVYAQGLIILDENHADYLAGCEAEFTAEGCPLHYFDTKAEVNQFESQPAMVDLIG